jgi:hypothetical protein
MAAGIVIAHPYTPPRFPPIYDELRPNFERTLMSSEGAPRYLPPSLDCSPSTDFLYRLTILPTDVDRWAFHNTDAPLLCSGARWREDGDGGARWMGRGSRLVRCPQSEIVDDVGMNPLGRERTKEGECRVAGPDLSRFLYFFLRHEACSPPRSSSSKPIRKSSWWFPPVHRISNRLSEKVLPNDGWFRIV